MAVDEILFCVFRNSGRVKGLFPVFVERIPANAPQDWTLGPKQTPGAWGAYHWNPASWKGWNQHGPYAFTVAPTAEAAAAGAETFFVRCARPWRACKTAAALRAVLRMEGLE